MMGIPRRHALKADPEPFDALWRGIKSSEVRHDDRGFKVGDEVLLQETRHPGRSMRDSKLPLIYTGRTMRAQITHIQRDYGLPPDLVVLSIDVREWNPA